MIGITDFKKLASDEQHNLILALLPLLKPFAARMDRNLEGLSYSVGLASKQLDLRDTWEKVEFVVAVVFLLLLLLLTPWIRWRGRSWRVSWRPPGIAGRPSSCLWTRPIRKV